jgi:repressor LexA
MNLTKQQRRVLTFLKYHWQERGGQPNLSEVAEGLDMHYVSLRQHLDAIAAKGYISFESTGRGKPPVIRLPEEGIPLLGEIAAGLPHEADSYTQGYLRVRGGGNRFGLKVRGESMADLIQPGDVVVLEKRPAKNGDICAVRVEGGDVTLKYLDLYTNNRELALLRPHNPDFDTLEIELENIDMLEDVVLN